MSKKETDRKRYIENRERLLEYQRKYDAAHPTRHKQWYRERVLREHDKINYLKQLDMRIWNAQIQSLRRESIAV